MQKYLFEIIIDAFISINHRLPASKIMRKAILLSKCFMKGQFNGILRANQRSKGTSSYMMCVSVCRVCTWCPLLEGSLSAPDGLTAWGMPESFYAIIRHNTIQWFPIVL